MINYSRLRYGIKRDFMRFSKKFSEGKTDAEEIPGQERL